jgi:hypothetical protein
VNSPGRVGDDEMIVRLVTTPQFVNDKTGQIKANIFSQAMTKGMSVQRDNKVGNQELIGVVSKILRGKDNLAWYGVISARASCVRSHLSAANEQAFCIYDTGEPENPAHAEICWSAHPIKDADGIESRSMLIKAFGNGYYTPRTAFRGGKIFDALPDDLRERKLRVKPSPFPTPPPPPPLNP